MPPKRATRSGSATKKAAAKPARAAPSTKAPSTNKVTKTTKPKKREPTPTRTSARIASRASSAAPSIAPSAPSDEELPLTATTIGAPSVRSRSTRSTRGTSNEIIPAFSAAPSIAPSAHSNEELPLTATTIGAPSVRSRSTRSTSIISVPETAIETIEELVEEPAAPTIFEEEEEEEVAALAVVEETTPMIIEKQISPPVFEKEYTPVFEKQISPQVFEKEYTPVRSRSTSIISVPAVETIEELVEEPEITLEPEEPEELASLRAEVARLRKAVQDFNKNKTASRRTAIKFHYAIAKPAAEMAAAQALRAKEEAAMAAEKERDFAREFSAPSPLPSSATPVESPKTPLAPISASPWGLRTMFSSVKRVFGRSITPSEQTNSDQAIAQQSITEQSTQPTQSTQRIQSTQSTRSTPHRAQSSQQSQQCASSPFSPPSPQMTPLISPSARKQQQQQQQQQQRRTPRVPQTPTPAPETSETPIRSERRRGLLPGSVNPQRTPRNKDTPRSKPVERNADKRAQNLEQAAERKRIQEQADALEEEKRKADAQDSSHHQAGDKRKRVRIDDLKTIPARRPGQSSGTFSLREEFFSYNDSNSDDDYVDMDVDEADDMVLSRPSKRMRYEDNIFNVPSTPAAPSTPAPAPAPAPSSASLQRQIGQATQYTPKQPSGLRQALTPRQISAATPAPAYYRTPAPLGDITEITEPSETPMPASRSQAPPPSPGSNPFGFPPGVDLWVSFPDLFTKEIVEEACRFPPTQAEIDAAAKEFAVGLEAYNLREQAAGVAV